ncbi:hypothetical protein A7U60_g4352 [Sanghuangporus baumii]|uniref:Uncharacterized protein n=1 Tax=Sanghuangporus baumii TaxID=108892 RepID=A0A9Q5HZH7_SANBA|nr:hypothetical protein A7U60_g4352 [Sanghuangporus baumii]
MVFRLPTPFDTIMPAAPQANGRRSRPRPWRGTFVLHGINLFQSPDGQQRLFVASAETEGNNRTDLWPKHFDMHIIQSTCLLSDVQNWVTRNEIPLCMFMPDRHAAGGVGSPGSIANEAHFRTLSGVLSENQLLCMAPWPNPGYAETRSGAGILVFPNAASTGLLIGAVFLDTPFPDILSLLPGDNTGASTSAIPSGLPSTVTTGGPPSLTSNLDFSTFASSSPYPPLPDPGAIDSTSGQIQGQGQVQMVDQGQPQIQIHLHDDSPARSMQHQHFAMTSNAAGFSGGQTQTQNYTKSQMDGLLGDGALRAALATAPFDWSIFDETTDGSGSTSPGSTRTW